MSTSAAVVPAPIDPLPAGEAGDVGVSALTLAQLRDLRRRLRVESERTAYWHRLAKARLDLVVAGALEGDPGASAARCDETAATAGGPLVDEWAPCFDSLRRLLLGDDTQDGDVVDRLHRIDDAERQLRGYGSSVRAAADEATSELVRRYHQEPATCLRVAPRPA